MRFFILFILLLSPLVANSQSSNSWIRLKQHLFIGDYWKAYREYQRFSLYTPQKNEEKKIAAEIYLQVGLLEKAIGLWEELYRENPQESLPLLEEIAWALLEQKPDLLSVSSATLMNASQHQDARTVKMLLKALGQPNSYTRLIAANAASHYPDEPIVEKLLLMLEKEQDLQVRLSVIRSLGKITDREDVIQKLKQKLTRQDLFSEERLVILEALCQSIEVKSLTEIQKLVTSSDISMRFFACFFMMNFGLAEDASLLLPLISDENLEVRIAAIFAMAILGCTDEGFIAKLSEQIDNQDPMLSMVASWAMIPHQGSHALGRLEELLQSSSEPLRRMACATIAHGGPIARELCVKHLYTHHDPYVRLCFARALLSDANEGKNAAKEIVHFLKKTRSRIMFSRHMLPIFQHIVPSKVRFQPQQQQFPIFVDQMARIQLLNEVSMKYPELSEEMLSQFLHSQLEGISFFSARAVLLEGSEEQIKSLQRLLKDKNVKVRVQAAVILSLIGDSELAFPVMLNDFSKLSQTMKMNVLMASGQIRDKRVIPFLVSILKEPFLISKTVAAASLLQAIYQ